MSKEGLLITGATGFIGYHVVRRLALEGSYQIVAIIKAGKKHRNVAELERLGVTMVEGLFYDKELLNRIFKEFSVRYVIHLAALRGSGAGSKEEYRIVNVIGTQLLLDASLSFRVKRFIFCSSVGVFGTIPRELPANTSTRLNGDSRYHISKILAEQKVNDYIAMGLDALIVRPTVTYGPGDDGFPRTLAELVRRRLFLPSRDVRIHLLSVDGLAGLMPRMLTSRSTEQRTFIAADSTPISLAFLVNRIHCHYHKTEYPSFLKLPYPIVRGLVAAFHLCRNEKWVTRLRLVSESWYYDINDTIKAFDYVPANTDDAFVKALGT